MSPAQILAQEIVQGIIATMKPHGLYPDMKLMDQLEQRIARDIQQVADDQVEQTDAEAFGDEPETYSSHVEHYGGIDPAFPPTEIVVTITPLFQQPTGNN